VVRVLGLDRVLCLLAVLSLLGRLSLDRNVGLRHDCALAARTPLGRRYLAEHRAVRLWSLIRRGKRPYIAIGGPWPQDPSLGNA
jgi:hypothetical protein